MRRPAIIATLAVLAVLASGCGSSDQSGSAAAPASSGASAQSSRAVDHRSMSGMDMGSDSDMDMGSDSDLDRGGSSGPSGPAAMICGSEIRDAVKRTYEMTSRPTGAGTWAKSQRLFSCRWSVPEGTLTMSVQDSLSESTGRAYFDRLRSRLSGTRLGGMQNFGFPAFRTDAGDVVFLKDGKTLRVDATELPDASLPQGFSRGETAYSVASAVIACWTE